MPGAEIATNNSVAPALRVKPRKNTDIMVWSSLLDRLCALILNEAKLRLRSCLPSNFQAERYST